VQLLRWLSCLTCSRDRRKRQLVDKHTSRCSVLSCHHLRPQVDCTREQALCQEHQITGFPSIRVFRKGSDEISLHGMHEHEAYRGASETPRWQLSLLHVANSACMNASSAVVVAPSVALFMQDA